MRKIAAGPCVKRNQRRIDLGDRSVLSPDASYEHQAVAHAAGLHVTKEMRGNDRLPGNEATVVASDANASGESGRPAIDVSGAVYKPSSVP